MKIPYDQFDRIADAVPGMGRDPASVRVRIEAMEQLLGGCSRFPARASVLVLTR